MNEETYAAKMKLRLKHFKKERVPTSGISRAQQVNDILQMPVFKELGSFRTFRKLSARQLSRRPLDAMT